MKKLSLKKLNLGANDLLQRNQLKTVFGGDGGYGGGGCGSGQPTCSSGKTHCCCNHVYVGCKTVQGCLSAC